jgi:hypothetical protein
MKEPTEAQLNLSDTLTIGRTRMAAERTLMGKKFDNKFLKAGGHHL